MLCVRSQIPIWWISLPSRADPDAGAHKRPSVVGAPLSQCAAMKSQVVLLSCLVLSVAAAQSGLDAAYGMVRSCGDAPVSSCLKRSAIALVDAALDAGDTPLFTGFTLVKAPPSPSESNLHLDLFSDLRLFPSLRFFLHILENSLFFVW